MEKEIIINSVEACEKLCGDGWVAEARIEEQSRNGVSTWMVGIFFEKDTKRKFAGRTVETEEEADELLESFQEGLDQYRAAAPQKKVSKKKTAKEKDRPFEPKNEEMKDGESDEWEGKNECGCGPHIDREKVGDHLICKHGFCLCGWQDDGIRQLGKLFGAEVFARTTDKKVLDKITKFLKGKGVQHI